MRDTIETGYPAGGQQHQVILLHTSTTSKQTFSTSSSLTFHQGRNAHTLRLAHTSSEAPSVEQNTWKEFIKFLVAGKATENPPILKYQEEKQSALSRIPKPSHAPLPSGTALDQNFFTNHCHKSFPNNILGCLFLQTNPILLPLMIIQCHSPNSPPFVALHCVICQISCSSSVSNEAMYSSSSFHSSSCCFLLSSTSSNNSLKVSSSSLIFLLRLRPRFIYTSAFSSTLPRSFGSSAKARTACSLFRLSLQRFRQVLLLSLTSDHRSLTTLETSFHFQRAGGCVS